MSGRWRFLASGDGSVEFLSTRTRHEKLMPTGAMLNAYIIRLAVGSRLKKDARSSTARVFCEHTDETSDSQQRQQHDKRQHNSYTQNCARWRRKYASNNNKNKKKKKKNHDNIYSAVIYGASHATVHFGSCGRKSVSARWPPTRRPSCKLDL